MSEVNGPVRRASLGLDSFADITGPEIALTSIRRDGLTFDADLTPEQAAEVWRRMESIDDMDQAARAILRDADTATNRWKLLRSYVLGDPMPEPTYPPE